MHKPKKRRKKDYIWWRKIWKKLQRSEKKEIEFYLVEKNREKELYLVEKKLGSLAAISLSVPVNLAICRDTSVSNEIYRLFQKYLLSMPKVLSRFYAEIMLVKSY